MKITIETRNTIPLAQYGGHIVATGVLAGYMLVSSQYRIGHSEADNNYNKCIFEYVGLQDADESNSVCGDAIEQLIREGN